MTQQHERSWVIVDGVSASDEHHCQRRARVSHERTALGAIRVARNGTSLAESHRFPRGERGAVHCGIRIDDLSPKLGSAGSDHWSEFAGSRSDPDAAAALDTGGPENDACSESRGKSTRSSACAS
jgi:hypothetical protein